MRVGIQSISWGRTVERLWEQLPALRDIGYEGIEVAQHPVHLGSPKELYERLSDAGLVLLGLNGGSTSERSEFLRAYLESAQACRGEAAPYVYIDGWEERECNQALQDGLTLALHPHMFKRVQTMAEAAQLLERRVALRFLPDTAHLTIAGEDVLGALKRYFSRVVAVHLKDWSAEVGRAYQFYSRGFTELGEGDVDLASTVEFLKDRDYGNWVVVEQEASHDPIDSSARSRNWLTQICGIGIS